MTDYSPQDPLLPPVVDPMYARPYTLVIDCKELIKPEYDVRSALATTTRGRRRVLIADTTISCFCLYPAG